MTKKVFISAFIIIMIFNFTYCFSYYCGDGCYSDSSCASWVSDDCTERWCNPDQGNCGWTDLDGNFHIDSKKCWRPLDKCYDNICNCGETTSSCPHDCPAPITTTTQPPQTSTTRPATTTTRPPSQTTTTAPPSQTTTTTSSGCSCSSWADKGCYINGRSGDYCWNFYDASCKHGERVRCRTCDNNCDAQTGCRSDTSCLTCMEACQSIGSTGGICYNSPGFNICQKKTSTCERRVSGQTSPASDCGTQPCYCYNLVSDICQGTDFSCTAVTLVDGCKCEYPTTPPPTCDPGWEDCGGTCNCYTGGNYLCCNNVCVNKKTDSNNCGSCGNTCGTGCTGTCSNKRYTGSCSSGTCSDMDDVTCGCAATECTPRSTCCKADGTFAAAGTDPNNDCTFTPNTGSCTGDTCNGAGACSLNSGGFCRVVNSLGACDKGATCQSGVCTNTGFESGKHDCGICKTCSGTQAACSNIAAGTDPNNDCTFTPNTGSCTGDTCNGAGACNYNSGGTCRTKAGDCDVEEKCSGSACPPNAFVAAGTVCDPKNDGGYDCPWGVDCGSDVAWRDKKLSCSGSSADCPTTPFVWNPWTKTSECSSIQTCDATTHSCKNSCDTCSVKSCGAGSCGSNEIPTCNPPPNDCISCDDYCINNGFSGGSCCGSNCECYDSTPGSCSNCQPGSICSLGKRSSCDFCCNTTTSQCFYYGCGACGGSCLLTSASITRNCGSDGICSEGETILMNGTLSGSCSGITHFQIDASGSGCSIQYNSGDMSGIYGSNPTIISNRIMGSWVISSIPSSCCGKTITASFGAIYSNGDPLTGTWIDNEPATGSFSFPACPTTTTLTTTSGSTTTTTCLPFKRICRGYSNTEWAQKYHDHNINDCGSGCVVGNTYYACQPNDADTACCPDNNCVYNGLCYTEGSKRDVDNDGFVELCTHGSNGVWNETEATPCTDDGDCPPGEECGGDNYCCDIRPKTGGCLYYDYCECGYDPDTAICDIQCSICTGSLVPCSSDWDNYCYVESQNQDEINVIREACSDWTYLPNVVRTCDE